MEVLVRRVRNPEFVERVKNAFSDALERVSQRTVEVEVDMGWHRLLK
jgi:hypothetical protein